MFPQNEVDIEIKILSQKIKGFQKEKLGILGDIPGILIIL